MSKPVRPRLVEPYDPITVVRVQRPDTPARQREPLPPKPEEKPPEPLKKAALPRPELNRPRLDFAVNPRLAPTKGDLSLPSLTQLSLFALPQAADSPLKMDFLPGELDFPLTAIHTVPPVYPFRARRLGIEGWVRVEFVVDENGAVQNPVVLEASPEGIFEDAVLQSVKLWRFSPPTREGRPVRTIWERKIEFALQ
ncbi:MAG: energy transducer TonB [Desulfatibacillaceae bacterium]|nr:energy transducer TonB [Desulfatibacillaceae bacterium]